MTTVLGDADGAGGERIHSQVIELEKQLRAKSKEKKDVRSLRAKFREKSVAIILGDPEFAEKRDIGASLWHLVFYNVIEEFRGRIRAAASAAAGGKAVNLRKLLGDFREFIADATKFYCGLVLKIKKKYGLAQEGLEGGDSDALGVDSKRLTYFRRSCYRIFIHLGDLARYKEQNPDSENYSPDWKLPASYYFKAVKLWPATGHPHNQLAVLATYSHNDFLAVYHYFRSLAVDDPFVTARDNLVLLFERNRQQYSELLEKKRSLDVHKKKPAKEHTKDAEKKHSGDDETELLRTFFIRFVRLNGILFTRTSLETFSEVYQESVRDLEKLLALDVSTLEGLFSPELRKNSDVSGLALVVLQLVTVLVYSVPSGSSRSSYADVLQHSTMSRHALAAAFKIVGCFMSSCTKFKDIGESPFMPACLVFLEWLAYKQEWAIGRTVEDDKQYGAQGFFWKEALALLNTVCEAESWDGVADEASPTALWEDHELRGFTPLLSAQLRLEYDNKQPEEAAALRLRRLLSAGKSIAELVDASDTGAGLAFDKDMVRFFLAGNHMDRRSREKVVRKVPEQAAKQEKQEPSGQMLVTEPPASASSVPVNEDEDDEVIVFKPAVKVAPPVLTDRNDGMVQAGTVTPQVRDDLVPPLVRGDQLVPQIPEDFPAPPIPDDFAAPPQARDDFTATAQLRDDFAALGREEQARDDFAAQPPQARDDFMARQEFVSQQAREELAALVRDDFAARAKLNSVRPPPGFGPIPQRAVSKWNEGYRSPAPQSLFGTNFGIWSNNIPVPKSTAYPFPGMGMRTLQQIEQQQQQQAIPMPPFQPPQPLYNSWKISDTNALELQLQQLHHQQQEQHQLHLQLQQQLQQQPPQPPQPQHPPPPPQHQQAAFRPYCPHDPFVS
ncbi:protein SMG7-like [Selaginella moellendorffii]|uniref:protein SMG7-like n=1 Tax=Selaginella moellendorffii TaxID=88036 RepID=UPI000D1CC71E|nr:protein SMG7-like [Selaginella moellendorffii]|eukprot:XP_024528737.1 protein SMG7-like [Selaginella moellendorffii]